MNVVKSLVFLLMSFLFLGCQGPFVETKVAAPVIGIDINQSPSTVTLSTETIGGMIYYTTDGTLPSPNDAFSPTKEYVVPFKLYKSAVIKAIAVKEGLEISDVVEETFIITPVRLSIGDSHDFNDIIVKIDRVFWVATDEYFVQPRNAIGIDISITNNRISDVYYSDFLVWGVLVDSNGYQIAGATYLWAINAEYFWDGYIFPESTIAATITFDEYFGTSTSFAFKGSPPIDDTYYFEMLFAKDEIVSKPAIVY